MDKLRIKARLNKNKNAEASAGIIDSQTVRWGNNRSLKSVDGNKKIKGIKRHIVVDKNGWLLAIMVSVAHVHDSKAADLLMRTLKERLIGIKLLIADGGYRGNLAEKIKTKFGYMLQIILRSDKRSNDFKPLPMRWVVKRTFAWFDNDRMLCRNYELLIDSAETMVKIATIKLLLYKI